MHRTLAFAALVAGVGGCNGESPPPPPIFPADYAETFQEVRDCRLSADHDLSFVRVYADPVALESYTTRAAPFPAGSLLVKEEHGDETCTDVLGFTAMFREDPGWDPEGGDWHWQKLDADRAVTQDGKLQRCSSCHGLCEAPDGFDWTCAAP